MKINVTNNSGVTRPAVQDRPAEEVPSHIGAAQYAARKRGELVDAAKGQLGSAGAKPSPRGKLGKFL